MSRAKSPKRTVQYYSPKRRAIMAAGDDIKHLAVFERDNWICGICGNKVDKRYRQPSPECATLDHVVPISVCLEEGWPIETIHTYDNVQCAHLSCNLDKGGAVPLECGSIETTGR